MQKYQVTCSVNGGDTFQATRAIYTGTATSADPRLAGAITIRAWSLVDTANGVGHVFGIFRIRGAGTHTHGTLNAALSGGKASGLARGFVRGPWGRLVASLGSTFDPSAGFSTGSLGGSTSGAGSSAPVAGAIRRTGRRAKNSSRNDHALAGRDGRARG